MTGKDASACPFSSNTAMMQGSPSSMSDTLHLPHIAALLSKIQDETVIFVATAAQQSNSVIQSAAASSNSQCAVDVTIQVWWQCPMVFLVLTRRRLTAVQGVSEPPVRVMEQVASFP